MTSGFSAVDYIKGRDLYDYVFYLRRGTPVNINHLRERLIDSGYISAKETCEIDDIKRMLNTKFDDIDYSKAKEDVGPFLKDSSSLDIWSSAFFKDITSQLKVL